MHARRKVGEGAARFFFSSRRRHTSWPGDWSSDVCSSDLEDLPGLDLDRQVVQRTVRALPPETDGVVLRQLVCCERRHSRARLLRALELVGNRLVEELRSP